MCKIQDALNIIESAQILIGSFLLNPTKKTTSKNLWSLFKIGSTEFLHSFFFSKKMTRLPLGPLGIFRPVGPFRFANAKDAKTPWGLEKKNTPLKIVERRAGFVFLGKFWEVIVEHDNDTNFELIMMKHCFFWLGKTVELQFPYFIFSWRSPLCCKKWRVLFQPQRFKQNC